MKLGIFTDSHYCRADVLCKTRRPALSLRKLNEAMQTFQNSGVDLVLCLGDLIDKGTSPKEPLTCIREAMELIRSFHIPYLILPGNHDYACFSAETFSKLTGCPTAPFTMDIGSHRLIVLDANYRSDYRRFDIAGVFWKDSNLPPAQVDFLLDTLNSADKPCIILLHENLDNEVQIDHIIKNADLVREILEKSGKVSLVLQGHYHPGADHTIHGIRYLTIPAMCEGEENRFLILEL